VPITFNDRVRGESKMSWHIIGEAMSLVTWWGLRDRLFRRTRPDVRPGDGDEAPTTVNLRTAAVRAATDGTAVAEGDVETASP